MTGVRKLKSSYLDLLEMMDVLQVLIRADHVRPTRAVQNLFIQLGQMVDAHFRLEEAALFRDLLIHEDQAVKATTQRFLDGKRELKKFFKAYNLRWCDRGIREEDCDDFIVETDRMFAMLRRWLRDVEERLYPLVAEAA